MTKYLVSWEIELAADSPREAAAKALAIQRDETSLAQVFIVNDPEGAFSYHVDLLDDEEPAPD